MNIRALGISICLVIFGLAAWLIGGGLGAWWAPVGEWRESDCSALTTPEGCVPGPDTTHHMEGRSDTLPGDEGPPSIESWFTGGGLGAWWAPVGEWRELDCSDLPTPEGCCTQYISQSGPEEHHTIGRSDPFPCDEEPPPTESWSWETHGSDGGRPFSCSIDQEPHCQYTDTGEAVGGYWSTWADYLGLE